MENDRNVKFRDWAEIVPGDLLIYMAKSPAAHTYLIVSRKFIESNFNFTLLSQHGEIINYTGMNQRAFMVIKLNKSNRG